MANGKYIGALLIALGILCLVYPIAASVWVEMVVGVCLLGAAFFYMVNIFSRDRRNARGYYVLLTLLYLAAGVLMLLNPFDGVEAVMATVGIVFAVEGFGSIALWSTGESRTRIPLYNGIISIILAVLLLANLSYGIWFVGVLAGVDMLVGGASILCMRPDSRAANSRFDKKFGRRGQARG